MTREELEAVPHPALKGTLAWEQQHEYLEFDTDSECKLNPGVCVQVSPSAEKSQTPV